MNIVRRRGGAKTAVVIVLVVVLLLIAAVVGLGARYLWYWGPSDSGRDFAQELYDLSLDATGREELGNAEDWALFTLVGQAYDDAFAAHEGSGAYPAGAADFAIGLLDPESAEWVVEEDEEWDESIDGPRYEEEAVPPEVRLAASRAMVEAFRAQGGFERLEELARAVEARGAPVRETHGAITLDYALPERGQARRVARILAFETRELALEGAYEAAVSRLELLFIVGEVCGAQNLLLDRLVWIAMNALAYEEVERLAQNPEVASHTLQRLESMARQDAVRGLATVAKGEALWGRAGLAQLMGTGRRFIPQSAEAQAAQLDKGADLVAAILNGDQSAAAELDTLQNELENDLRYRAAWMYMISSGAAFTAERQLVTLQWRTLLVVAIELFRRANGVLPESLNDVASAAGVDTSDFVYERTDEPPGYTLTHPDIWTRGD